MMNGWNDGPTGWGWLWMIAMMALIWVPILIAAVWLLSSSARRDSGRTANGWGAEDAQEIARRTYARGEIDRARYLEIMADLKNDSVDGGRTS